eukprot:645184-Rhodomonas_salina.1
MPREERSALPKRLVDVVLAPFPRPRLLVPRRSAFPLMVWMGLPCWAEACWCADDPVTRAPMLPLAPGVRAGGRARVLREESFKLST